MELRHDACRNEPRDRHHRRWKFLCDEVSGGRFSSVKKVARSMTTQVTLLQRAFFARTGPRLRDVIVDAIGKVHAHRKK